MSDDLWIALIKNSFDENNHIIMVIQFFINQFREFNTPYFRGFFKTLIPVLESLQPHSENFRSVSLGYNLYSSQESFFFTQKSKKLLTPHSDFK